MTRYHRRPGTPAIDDLLRGLHPDIAAAGSPFEVYGLLALRDPKLPPPTLQHEVLAAQGRVVRRVDAAWPGPKVAVEFDGRASHQTPSQLAKDRRHRDTLRQLGWIVLEPRAEDLRDARLEEVRASLRHLLTTR